MMMMMMMMMRVRKRRRSCGVVGVNFFSKKNQTNTKQNKSAQKQYAQYISSLYFVHAVSNKSSNNKKKKKNEHL